jgi:hypothetical protein
MSRLTPAEATFQVGDLDGRTRRVALPDLRKSLEHPEWIVLVGERLRAGVRHDRGERTFLSGTRVVREQ